MGLSSSWHAYEKKLEFFLYKTSQYSSPDFQKILIFTYSVNESNPIIREDTPFEAAANLAQVFGAKFEAHKTTSLCGRFRCAKAFLPRHESP